MNSREKGKRGEREFRDELREFGFLKACRGQQFRGGSDSPDVRCPELPEIHFEVKRCQKGHLYDWVAQAQRESGSKQFSVVAHKKNNSKWLAVMSMDDFLKIVGRSDLVQECDDQKTQPQLLLEEILPGSSSG